MQLTAFLNDKLLTDDACREVPKLLEAGHVVAAMAAGEALIRSLVGEIKAFRESKLSTDVQEQAQDVTRQVVTRAREALATLPEAEVHRQARAFATELGAAFRPQTPSYRLRGLVVRCMEAMKGLDPELDPACTFLPAWYQGQVESLEELAAQLPGSFALPHEIGARLERLAKAPKEGAKLRATWTARGVDALMHPAAADPRAAWVDQFLREEIGSKSRSLGDGITRALAAGDLAEARRLLEVLLRTLPDAVETKRASLMVLAREALEQPAKRAELLASIAGELAPLLPEGRPEVLDDEVRPSVAELLVQRACLLASDGRLGEALDELRRAVRIHPASAKRLPTEPVLAPVCSDPAAQDVLAAKPEALLTAAERTEAHLVRAIRASVRHAGDIDNALIWSERAALVARAEGSDDWIARAMAARSRILSEHDETRDAKAALKEAEAAAARGVTVQARAEVALARALASRDAGGKKAKVAYEAARAAARACGARSAMVGYVADEISRYLNGIEAPLEEIVAVLDEGVTALNGFLEDHPARGEDDRSYGEACVDLMSLLASRAYVAQVRTEPREVVLELIGRASVAARGARANGYFFADGFTSTLMNLALTIETTSGPADGGVVAGFFDALGVSPRLIEEKRFFRAVRQLAGAILQENGAAAAAGFLGAAVTGNLPRELDPEEHPELFGLFSRAQAWPGFMSSAAMSFRAVSLGAHSLGDALGEVEELAMTYVDEDEDEGGDQDED